MAADEKKAEKTGEAASEEINTKAQKKRSISSDEPIAFTEVAVKEFLELQEKVKTKEKELEERERALEIQEKIIREKLGRIEKLNKAMSKRLDEYKEESNQNVDKLVKIIEGMKPVEAARFVENIDPGLAVNIFDKISVQRASKILNMIDKRVSARLTEKYTGFGLREKLKEEQASRTKPNG